MNYRMLIGETLFDINTSLAIRWKEEELSFLYHGGSVKQHIIVNIHMVSQLPDIMCQEIYQTDGIRFGFDDSNHEVRLYHAPHIDGNPTYAASVLNDSIVTIYFVNNLSIWYNPNIRIWNLVHMERLLLNVGTIVLHCSYLMYDNKAILFSAPSGTGKTTQAKLWEKLYPARIINGDKAIVLKKGDTWYAYGYPFHGSAPECFNECYPIEAIVIVRQSPKDYIEELRPLKQLQFVYCETTVASWSPEDANQALNLISSLTSSVKVVCQHCTMNDEACYSLHRYLKER